MTQIERIYLGSAFVGLVVLFVFLYYFLRYVFSIKRQLWNQRQQLNLLISIAEKIGATEGGQQLTQIKAANNNPDDEFLDKQNAGNAELQIPATSKT